MYWYVQVHTGTYQYILVRTILPVPVQVYRIPDVVPAALERSTPAQPAADEEESQGEEQGGQAKRGQGGKSDARSGSQAELETRVREILCKSCSST